MKKFFKTLRRFTPDWGVKSWILFILAIFWILWNFKTPPEGQSYDYSMQRIGMSAADSIQNSVPLVSDSTIFGLDKVDYTILKYFSISNSIDAWKMVFEGAEKSEGSDLNNSTLPAEQKDAEEAISESKLTSTRLWGLALPFIIVFIVVISLRNEGNIFGRLYGQASNIKPIDKSEE